MVRRFTFCLRVFALAVNVLIGLVPASDMLLCIAADGHTAVEIAHRGSDCLTDLHRHHAESASACTPAQHGCNDVVLSPVQGFTASTGSAIGNDIRLVSSISVLDPSDPNQLARIRLDSDAPLGAPGPLSNLRTIILIV